MDLHSGRRVTDPRLDREWPSHRPAVFGAAYRITGSVADAEDVVQDTWLRAASRDLGDVRDLRAWLVTVAARRALDVLTSARARRVDYVGPWLPEPLLTGPDAAEPVLLDAGRRTLGRDGARARAGRSERRSGRERVSGRRGRCP
jgi:DNA-directed RNA polymerase specialized sigma24 family protein